MARGISLHIGVNYVDINAYASRDMFVSPLAACVSDARVMQSIAHSQGFETKFIQDEEATADAILTEISNAARDLKAGDMFMLTYAGHGSQVPDDREASSTQGDEKWDETWVLYDRQLIDDELYAAWSDFAKGVNILVVSDSCHSGTITRNVIKFDEKTGKPILPEPDLLLSRAIHRSDSKEDYEAQKELYQRLKVKAASAPEPQASILLLAGCQDHQTAMEQFGQGKFTRRLKKVWRNGNFHGDYNRFFQKIKRGMSRQQTPNMYWANGEDPDFATKRPFSFGDRAQATSRRSGGGFFRWLFG